MIIAIDGFKKKEVKLCNESRYLNTLVLGQKGTGKSETVLLNMFYQDLAKKDHSLLVFSSKGDTSYKLYTLAKEKDRKVHLIKPEANTFHINLLKGNEQDVIDYMVQLFDDIFKGANQGFSQEMNKTLLKYSLKVVKRTLGDNGTLEDVWNLMSNPNGIGRKMATGLSRLCKEDERLNQENAFISSWFLNEYYHELKGNLLFESCGAIRMKIRELLDYHQAYHFTSDEEGIPDFKKVLKNKEVVIVDTEFLTYKEYAHFMGTYLLLRLKQELLQLDTAESFVYIDDFQKFYPVLTELFEGSHIKSFGVTLFLQENKQLNIYPDYKHVIANSVTNVILLERIAIEDYHFYKEDMNAELLNRKKGEIVYKIINKEGTSEKTNGFFYTIERLVLDYEKYLDYKKQLTRKRRKRTISKKIEETAEEKTVQEEEEEVPTAPKEQEGESEKTSRTIRVFEQVKREGDGKEYLSPDAIFGEEDIE